MKKSNVYARRAFLPIVLLLVLALTGCATVPPKPIGYVAPTASPSPSPESNATPPSDALQPTEPAAPIAVPSAETTQPAAAGNGPVTKVELFFSGMPSMMGFADAPQVTVYETAAEALAASVSLVWPGAAANYYRYGADVEKAYMALSKDQLLQRIGDPSFYLDSPLLRQPARLKRPGAQVITDSEPMNEPVPGYFDRYGGSAPAAKTSLSGTSVAVLAADPTALTLIVTDLHDLRADDGTLLSALTEKCLKTGRSVGVAAISSEFAGLIPDIGSNRTAFVWGSPPTGTRDYMLDFDEYKVGVSVDPETRRTAPRPFYVLCIGEQSAVDTFFKALSERLNRELSGNGVYKLRTAIFGSGLVPPGYQMGGNMRYLSGQGVTAVPDANAPGGVSLIELKASQQARYLEWEIDYKAHPSDPRGAALSAGDFAFFATATAGGHETELTDASWSVSAVDGGNVKIKLRLGLPSGVLSQGQYTLSVEGCLIAPADKPGADWIGEFGYDADGALLLDAEQDRTAFDGSRTLFLSRLIDALGQANASRTGLTPLGIVTFSLTVYA